MNDVCRLFARRSGAAMRVLGLAALGALAGCERGGGGGSQGGFNLFGSRTGAGGRAAGDREVWTIECNAYEGPNHREMADSMATALKRVSNLRADAVSVEHSEQRSRVFYGTYELSYARSKEGGAGSNLVAQQTPQLKDDLRYIKTLSTGGQYPFFSARAIPRPIEDVGPQEWDLRHAKGTYTLHVGVTYPTADLHEYKQAAVEWVKALRDEGYEAYYYHDPDKPKSDVCVGTFGEDALVREKSGSHHYNEAVLRLQSQSDFRWNLENGHKVSRTQPEGGTLINQSFLVRIPRPVSARPTRAAAGS